MRVKFIWSLLVTVACIFGATNLAAKAGAVDNGAYTTKDKEFYLTPEELLFIRPGLDIEILDVVIPADMQLEVTYSIKDPAGLGLDHDGVTTPGVTDMRFTLANIPMGEEQKVRLAYERISRNGTLTSLGDGVYKYKFDYMMESDQDTTHSLVLGGRRDLREFDLDRYADNAIQVWVPSGMYDAVPRDIVTTDTCNRCHDPLQLHGRWQQPQACTQCHNETGNTRFEVLIHAVHAATEAGGHDFSEVTYPAPLNACETCHTGGTPTENFPMVAAPTAALVCDGSGLGTTTLNWEYTGPVDVYVRTGTNPAKLFASGNATGSATTGKWVRDGTFFDLYDQTTQELVQTVNVNATVLNCVGNEPGTFRGVAGAQHTNWLDNPTRAVCGAACHDVDFTTGEDHVVITNDEACVFCHEPTGSEYGLSVKGAHTELYRSVQLPGIVIEILSVTDTDPGDTPTVNFSMTGKNGSLAPSSLAFFNLVMAGPNDDFDFLASEFAGGAVQVGNNWSYTFNTPLPADAAGSFTVGAEAFTMVPVNMGGGASMQRHTAENTAFAFAVTDAVATPRRMVVDDAKCENCHSNLALHGTIRHEPQYCVTCHMPEATDEEELQPGAEEQSIHFKYMIHKIHRGSEAEYPYVVAGHNQSVHDYGEVEYPGDLRNCDACHVGDSQQLPLPDGVLASVTPQELWELTPVAAACISCHDSDDASIHAYTNSTSFGEACSTCHGEGKDLAVDKVHAR